MLFVGFTVIQLCNVNQQNAHFLKLCFDSFHHVFFSIYTNLSPWFKRYCVVCFIMLRHWQLLLFIFIAHTYTI
jgi:hypothetical protein